MCANIGVIIGPMIGGLTSDPASSYPSLFGEIAWLKKFPYSPPQVISAGILCFAALAVFFGLEEVSSTLFMMYLVFSVGSSRCSNAGIKVGLDFSTSATKRKPIHPALLYHPDNVLPLRDYSEYTLFLERRLTCADT